MKKIYRWFCIAEEALCGTGFLFLVAFIFLSALLRLFRYSLSWSLDLAMLLLAWTAFLGADIAWRDGQIIGVNLFTRNLPKNLQRMIELLIYFIILAVLGVMFYYGILLAWSDRTEKYQSMPIPYSLVTISLVVASLSMMFSTIQKITRTVMALSGKTPDTESLPERSEDTQ